MDASSLDELHDTRNKDVLSVADRVDLNLFSVDVFIHQYGLIFIYFDGSLEIMAKLIVIRNDLHCAPAKDE